MARGKAVPKKREREEEAPAGATPITPELLEEKLERAEVEALRSRIASGAVQPITFREGRPSSKSSSQLDGLCRISLDSDYAAFQLLHDIICAKLEGSLARWGGINDSSGRLRGYGYVRGTLGEKHFGSAHELCMREFSGAQVCTVH